MRCLSSISVVLFLLSTVCAESTIAGEWSIQPVAASMRAADGTKTVADLGPARCGAVALLDGDGVEDLLVGHGLAGGGAVVFYSGNPERRLSPKQLIWRAEQGLAAPNAFRSDATVFELTFAPDWLSAGDFDGDGTRDLAAGARGLNELVWMPGDGSGGFGDHRSIPLPGAATAWTSGEINHLDGRTDIVVAVQTTEGARLVVFSGLEGAFTEPPRFIELTQPSTALATGMLDGDHTYDLAVASGREVLVFSGGDSRLSVDPGVLSFDGHVEALAVGDFTGESYRQLIVGEVGGTATLVDLIGEEAKRNVLPLETGSRPTILSAARVAGESTHDLLVFGPERHGFYLATSIDESLPETKLLGSPVVQVVPVRLNADARDDLVLLSEGSITPQILLTKTQFIVEVTHDDDTNDGFCDTSHCSLREAIVYVNGLGGPASITFDEAIRTIVLTSNLPQLTQSGCTIDGTVGSPTFPLLLRIDGDGVEDWGLTLSGGSSTVNGTAIFACGAGILIASDANLVESCQLGIDSTGPEPGNLYGVSIQAADDNTIGGTAVGAGNSISDNTLRGVMIDGQLEPANSNSVLGNRIGLWGDGGVQPVGVQTVETVNTQIGSTDAPNIISGNAGYGVYSLESSGTVVQANVIGLDGNGAPFGNEWTGVRLDECPSCWIHAGNTIAHNGINNFPGVLVVGALSTGVLLNNNEIFDNAGIGIDLGLDGVTFNDVGDPDAGTNNLQNFPVITMAHADTGEVQATLDTDGPPGTVYNIYFFQNTDCDSTGFGEGEQYLGKTTTLVPPSGPAPITATLSLTPGNYLTAIASHATNHNSSEFSACYAITGGIFADGFESGDTSAWQ